MRHRKRGRILGRNPSHRKAMLRNMASNLILTERETFAEIDENIPKVPGRIITTVAKAKEVRSLVEKCITIARRSLPHQEAAERLETDAERNTPQWQEWRNSDKWRQWNEAIAPALAARRRALQMLGSKQAVSILFEDIAPRYADRPGGYTRVVRIAERRLGDAGEQAILEFVGKRDRQVEKSQAPAFDTDENEDTTSTSAENASATEPAPEAPSTEAAGETPGGAAAAEPEASTEESSDEEKS